MCLIIYKKELSNTFNDNYMRTSIDRNSDGAGVMYVEDGRVKVEKIEGVTNQGIFEQDIFNWCKSMFESKGVLVMHHRMTTDGSNHLDNIHPYKVLSIDDGDAMDLYMVHNGIISECRPATTGKSFYDSYNCRGTYLDFDYEYYDDYARPSNKVAVITEKVQPSDTQIFINQYLKPILQRDADLLYTDALQKLIQGFIGTGNKLVFLDSNEQVTMINEDGGKQLTAKEGGCWISNTYSHLSAPKITYPTTYNKGRISHYPSKYTNTVVPLRDATIIKEEEAAEKTQDKINRYYAENDITPDEVLEEYANTSFWEGKTAEEVVELLCMTNHWDDISSLILEDVDMAEEVMSHLLDFYWMNSLKFGAKPVVPVTTTTVRKVVTTQNKSNNSKKNITTKKAIAKQLSG